MSLVENALGKARSGAVPGRLAPAERKAEVAEQTGQHVLPSIPRKVDRPALTIDEAVLRASGFQADGRATHQAASECRHIKRRLLAESDPVTGEFARVTMITSAVAGEGKTFAAFNLALSLARDPDYSVLLIDADAIRPRLSAALGVSDRRGLTDAAHEAGTLPESLVLSTNIEGLSVLPVGQKREECTELFCSHQFRQVMAKLAAPANRLIVIDSLPLLQTTEAMALTPYAGTVVVVVRANMTPRSALTAAMEQLDQHPHVLAILNCAEPPLLGRLFGHGYGYHYYEDYAPR
jgi:protein-tyrosine kinase